MGVCQIMKQFPLSVYSWLNKAKCNFWLCGYCYLGLFFFLEPTVTVFRQHHYYLYICWQAASIDCMPESHRYLLITVVLSNIQIIFFTNSQTKTRNTDVLDDLFVHLTASHVICLSIKCLKRHQHCKYWLEVQFQVWISGGEGQPC